MSEITPKEYTLNAFRGTSGKRISEVLKRYWKHVNYYKNENKTLPKEGAFDQVAIAQEIFAEKEELQLDKGV